MSDDNVKKAFEAAEKAVAEAARRTVDLSARLVREGRQREVSAYRSARLMENMGAAHAGIGAALGSLRRAHDEALALQQAIARDGGGPGGK